MAFSMGVMAMTFPNLRNPRDPTGRGLTRLLQEVIEVPDMPTEEAPATEKYRPFVIWPKRRSAGDDR